MKAMILAAGLGTRLKPFTNNNPKALAPVNGKSLLEINIKNLQKFGIKEVVVNVHHFANQIETVLKVNNGFGSQVVISDESAEVLETGGGLKKAAHLLNDSENILIMNVDILSDFDLSKMLDQHLSSKALVTLAVQKRSSSRFFLFENKDNFQKLCGWRNAQTLEEKLPCGAKNNANELAFSGIQIINRSFLNKIIQEGKFSLVDTYLSMCCNENIYAWNHTGDTLLDVGKPESLEKAAILFPNI